VDVLWGLQSSCRAAGRAARVKFFSILVMYNGPVAHDHPSEAPVSADADGLRKAILNDTDDALAWNAYADWLAERSFDKAAAHVRAFQEEQATAEGLVQRHLLLASSSYDAGCGL
jgi:uncharacterized protein (TIGR02996 family)